ncbi:helix-turn-helix domain-containing protein [Priestia megaterium]
MGLGIRLKELRKQNKLTLKQVGDHLGMTGVAISCYENETRKPAPEIIQKLANLYNTTTDDLLDNENERTSNIRHILNSNKLHWDGIPLNEDELQIVKNFLEYAFKDKEKELKEVNKEKNIINE